MICSLNGLSAESDSRSGGQGGSKERAEARTFDPYDPDCSVRVDGGPAEHEIADLRRRSIGGSRAT